MILTTDFHTHILPGIDDGSNSIDDSLKMIHKEIEDGVNHIVLTPHFDPRLMYPDDFVYHRQESFKQLIAALANHTYVPEFILGAEVYFSPAMSQWEQLSDLRIGKTKYILIEMPLSNWTSPMLAELKSIYNDRGYTPILAHIERYIPVIGVRRLLRMLSDLPVLLQSNCEFIIDSHTQRNALKLIKHNKIHFWGSDCHSSEWRSPTMEQARKLLISRASQDYLQFLQEYEKMLID